MTTIRPISAPTDAGTRDRAMRAFAELLVAHWEQHDGARRVDADTQFPRKSRQSAHVAP
jgi:hypothetical protein